MKIQFNTDKSIKEEDKNVDYFSSLIAEEIDMFQSYISKIEVDLSDENEEKDGLNDILCILEVRLDGRKPLSVSNQADTIEQAISGATDKLKNSLEAILGQIQNH